MLLNCGHFHFLTADVTAESYFMDSSAIDVQLMCVKVLIGTHALDFPFTLAPDVVVNGMPLQGHAREIALQICFSTNRRAPSSTVRFPGEAALEISSKI
jgi:hypothetical protein